MNHRDHRDHRENQGHPEFPSPRYSGDMEINGCHWGCNVCRFRGHGFDSANHWMRHRGSPRAGSGSSRKCLSRVPDARIGACEAFVCSGGPHTRNLQGRGARLRVSGGYRCGGFSGPGAQSRRAPSTHSRCAIAHLLETDGAPSRFASELQFDKPSARNSEVGPLKMSPHSSPLRSSVVSVVSVVQGVSHE